MEQLEAKMLTQESVISNMELRSDFSLYCVHMETQLVYAYLETLSSILNSLVSLRIRSHSEVSKKTRAKLDVRFFIVGRYMETGATSGPGVSSNRLRYC